MSLTDYLVNNNDVSRPIQIINGNSDVLYWGNRSKIPFDCSAYWVTGSFDIIGAADCVMVEYDI